MAHVLNSAVLAAEAFSWDEEEIATPERELAEALHDAAAQTYHCPAPWHTAAPVRKPTSAEGEPTDG